MKEKKITVQLKKEVDSPTVDVADGDYQRSFNRSEQPFQVTESEWRILARTDLFVTAEAKPTRSVKPAASVGTEQK